MLVSPRNMDIDSLSTILFNDEILGVSFQQFCDVGIHRTGRLLWHRTVRMPWPRTVSPKRKQRKRKTARAKNTRLGNWERISLANSLVMALKCSPQATAFGSMNWFVYICVMSLNKNTIYTLWKFLDLPKDRGKEKEREACSPISTAMDFEPPSVSEPGLRCKQPKKKGEKEPWQQAPAQAPAFCALKFLELPN